MPVSYMNLQAIWIYVGGLHIHVTMSINWRNTGWVYCILRHPIWYNNSLSFVSIWESWRCRGLNPRPFTCEANALPLSYIPCSSPRLDSNSIWSWLHDQFANFLSFFRQIWRVWCSKEDGFYTSTMDAWLAQSVEHETLNLRVVGSSPTLGAWLLTLTHQLALIHWSDQEKVEPLNWLNQQAMQWLFKAICRYHGWGYSSVAEHSTADREVAGSTPAVP